MDADTALDLVERLASRRAAITTQHEAAIEDAYRAGASLGQIAARCAFTTEGVRRLLLRRGVELRPPHVR